MGFSKEQRSQRDISLQNAVFSQIQLIDRIPNSTGRAYWNAICLACGKQFEASEKRTLSGQSKTCGCQQTKYLTEGNSAYTAKCINNRPSRLIGKRFGMLQIIDIKKREYGDKDKIICTVRCDCGVVKQSRYCSVKVSKSCGCIVIANNKSRAKEFSAEKDLFHKTKQGASKRSLSCNISFDYFMEIIKKPCHYCGSEPKLFKLNDSSQCYKNGIDRIDNNVGYEPENCVPCCKICNRGKSSLSKLDWDSYLEGMYRYMKIKYNE